MPGRDALSSLAGQLPTAPEAVAVLGGIVIKYQEITRPLEFRFIREWQLRHEVNLPRVNSRKSLVFVTCSSLPRTIKTDLSAEIHD